MLKGWPVEKLFWWSCLPENNRHFGQRVAAHAVAGIPPRLYPTRRLRFQKSWFLENFWSRWAAVHLQKTLAAFQPEAIWVIPHGWSIPPLAKAVPAANVGYHVSIHDYADTQSAAVSLGAGRSRRFGAGADLLYARADTRDAISDSMVADLRARTGVSGHVSHAGLEQDDFEYLAGKPEKTSETIRIAYAGSISTEPTFVLFARAVDAVRAKLSRPVSLEIFSAHSYADRPWFDKSWMRERGNLPEPRFTRALRDCTWGFAPMSFAEDDPRHRFSLSTKLVSYLAAGLPVFTMGHPETGVVRMAKKYGVGVCVDSEDPGPLREKIAAALAVENPWRTFGPEIMRCARTELDATRLRQTLHNCLRACARKTAAGGK